MPEKLRLAFHPSRWMLAAGFLACAIAASSSGEIFAAFQSDDRVIESAENPPADDGLDSVFARPVTRISRAMQPRPLPIGAVSVLNAAARNPSPRAAGIISRDERSLEVTAVNALGPSTVEIVYELPVNYPTASCVAPNIGYFQLYRAVDTTVSGGYAHWDGRKLEASWWTAGEHTLPIDLECVAGKYLIIFIPENPECFSVFGASFSFYKGVVSDFNNGNYQWLTDQHPGAGVSLQTSPNCDSCPCPPNVSTQQQGDSATTPSADQTITETLQYLARGSAGCGSCGTGSPGNDPAPIIPFTFSMNNHLAAFPTSLGAGVHTPFDFSTHAWMNYVDNKIRIRLVDSANSRIVTFVQNSVGSALFSDGTDLYREARLVGGTTLPGSTHIEIETHDRTILKFQLFETADDTDSVVDRAGRLVSWKNLAGRGYDITYQDNVSRRIQKITDPHGAETDFTWGGNQGGRPAVATLTFQNDAVASFSYSDHVLSNVSINRDSVLAWQWTNTKSDESNLTKMVITSPTVGQRVYRYYKDYLYSTSGYMRNPLYTLHSIRGTGDSPNIVSVSATAGDPLSATLTFGAQAVNGDRSVFYKHGYQTHYASQAVYDPDLTSPTPEIAALYHSNNNRNVWGGPIGEEGPPPVSANEFLTGSPPTRITEDGLSLALLYDTEQFLTKRTWPDATIEEFTWDSNKRLLRYRDRLGNVTRYEYNAAGAMTKREVGLKATGVGSPDTATPEYAVYLYTRSNDLLATEFSPLWTNQSDMYRTDYQYETTAPNIGKVKKIIYSADVASGTRPETTFVWNARGELQSTTDPQGRVTTFAYDAMGRTISVTYHNGSKDQTLYRTGTEGGLVHATRDQRNVVTTYSYDSRYREIESVVGAAVDANLLDGLPYDTTITDPNQKLVRSREFFTDTDLVKSETINGKTTKYMRDGMNRAREVRTKPHSSKTLVDKTGFSFYLTRYTEDWMGRRTFRAYDSQGRHVRTLVETKPGATGLTPTSTDAAILAMTRDLSANALWLITDQAWNAGSELVSSTDERGIVTTMEYDSRSQMFRRIAASGTGIAAKTETSYDLAGNVTEVRSPRYFDSGDVRGFNLSKTTTVYNGRELPKTVSVVLNGTEVASTHMTYTLDGNVATRTDPLTNVHTTNWHLCCVQVRGNRDPENNGPIFNFDFGSNVTHTIHVKNFDAQFSPTNNQHNPADADTFAEGTVKLDILGRQVMQTTWLSPRGTIDPNSVPIAGLDADGSGTLDAPLADGLTSVIAYDHNLGDGVGLETTGGMSVPNPGSLTPVNVSANAILAQLATDTGMSFGAGHSGSAVLSVNAEGETSLAISDALGRTVMVAQTQPHTQQVSLVAIAWSYSIYDNTHDIGTGGVPFLVAETRSRDAFGNISKSRSDGAGRVLQNVDEDGNISRMTYSATSEILSFRDPNDVGYDATFDQLGRELSRTDTYGNSTSTGYDLEGNAISQTDGKTQTTQFQYDAANRRTKVIDRLAGNTIYGYDLNGNEISIVDAESQTTLYTYNSRGHRATETYPDHVGGSNPGDAGYGIVAFEFDPMGGLQRRTDQHGDTVTMNYDLASRILQRDYRTRVNSPSGTIADSDVFTHDRMGRMLTGASGRYSNTVAMAFDDIGRPQSESLTISGQTYTTGYTHDAMNRRSGMTLPDGSVVLRTYTSRSQLHQAKLDGFTLDTRTYDAGGRHSTSTYGNGVVITHAYRTNGALKDDLLASISTTHPGGIPSGQQVGNYSYTWDANRNKLSESITGILSGTGFTPVTFDNEERITAWSRSDGNQGQTWSLSLVGDWNTHAQTGTVAFTQNRVHGPAHEFNSLTGTASGTLAYDSKGNNTARPATLAAPALNLTWDFGNQLSGVDTNGTPASQEVTFRYDVLGRRVGRVEGGSSVVFVQAGQQTIADYDAGQVPTKPNHIYVYGSYIDEPIARRESGSHAYFHRNQQYSIIALSNSSGAVIERYSYTAHGQLSIYNAAGTVLSASAFDNRLTYTGREWDATLALHYFRARWYDPLAGRFISRDPLGYVDGMNAYFGYFGLDNADPFGFLRVAIRVNAFIPFPWIGPGIRFKGDDRNISPDPLPLESSRALSVIVVELEECVSKEPFVDEFNNISESTQWLPGGIYRSGIGSKEPRNSVRRLGPCSVEVTFRMSSTIPWSLAPLAPAIDWDLKVTVDACHLQSDLGNSIHGSVSGKHDGFPAYEVYVDSTLVYSLSPTQTGKSEKSLIPPMDIDVGKDYRLTTYKSFTCSDCDCETRRDPLQELYDCCHFKCRELVFQSFSGPSDAANAAFDRCMDDCFLDAGRGIHPFAGLR